MFQFIKICLVVFFVHLFMHSIAQEKNDTIPYKGYPIIYMDSSVKVAVRDIVVNGNKITKDYLILREIPFKVKDSIAPEDFIKQFEQAKQLIYNTTLFNEVKISEQWVNDFEIDVLVEVKERWYIYPIPQFTLADRNLNEWIKTHKADFKRVNYGIKFIDYNLSGRRDQLRIYLLNGYSKNISVNYAAPYSNSALTEGFSIGAGFSQYREIPIKTSFDNKILLFKQDGFVRKNWFASAGYIIRRGYFVRHYFNVTYAHFSVSDSVIQEKYNPNYFKKSVTKINFPDISYLLQYINVDNASYPLKGKIAYFNFLKRGLSFSNAVDMLSVEVGANKYWSFGKKWYVSAESNAKIKLPFEQAYINQRGLGYGNIYLRGLDNYVIDGVATALLKSTLKKRIIYFTIPLPIRSKSHPVIPISIFAKTYADIGYAYNKKKFDSFLNNKFLYTGGVGIDIYSLYDANLRIEYSFNQLNEKGLFLQIQSAF